MWLCSVMIRRAIRNHGEIAICIIDTTVVMQIWDERCPSVIKPIFRLMTVTWGHGTHRERIQSRKHN